MAEVLVHREAKALLVPALPRIQQALNGIARPFDHAGRPFLAMPHNTEAVSLLNNIGVPAPAPILTQYKWPGRPPWKIQKTTAALLSMSPRAYVLNTMGTGKTRSTLYALDWLMQQGLVRKALVASTLSTLTLVWDAETMSTMPYRKVAVLHGTRDKRRKMLAQDVDIYVINHDGLTVMKDDLLAREDIDAVVFDELAVLRNRRTALWKAAKAVTAGRKYVWGLTGSPTPQAPTDAWGQIRLITPNTVSPSFREFQDATMFRASQFKWVPKRGAQEVVRQAMRPSVRFVREDVIELPPCTYAYREAAMTPKQAKIFKTIKDHFQAEWEDGRVTAANEGVKINKLLQVASGFVYIEKDKPADLPAQPRLSAMREILEEAGDEKVIIFSPFKHLARTLHANIEKKYGPGSAGFITGDVNKKTRDDVLGRFQNGLTMRCLVAHPATMSHGLTLTAASTVLWYAPIYSLETYEQANARITRPGQTRHQNIIMLYASPLERQVYQRLEQKATMQGLLLDMFRGAED